MCVESNISVSLYTRVSLLQSGRVYTILPYPNSSCSLLFSRIIHGFSVVPRGKLRSWKVGKLLPLLVCPRCVIDTGHGMDGSVEGEAATNGRTAGRMGVACNPRGAASAPRGQVVLTYFWLLIFIARRVWRTRSQPTHAPGIPLPLPLTLTPRSTPLPFASCLF